MQKKTTASSRVVGGGGIEGLRTTKKKQHQRFDVINHDFKENLKTEFALWLF